MLQYPNIPRILQTTSYRKSDQYLGLLIILYRPDIQYRYQLFSYNLGSKFPGLTQVGNVGQV